MVGRQRGGNPGGSSALAGTEGRPEPVRGSCAQGQRGRLYLDVPETPGKQHRCTPNSWLTGRRRPGAVTKSCGGTPSPVASQVDGLARP